MRLTRRSPGRLARLLAIGATITASAGGLRASPSLSNGAPVHEAPAANAAAPTPNEAAVARQSLPKITVTARSDTIFGGVETYGFRVTREGSLTDSLTVTLRLEKEQDWISRTSIVMTIPRGRRTWSRAYSPDDFNGAVTTSGTITATADAVAGYDMSEASATMYVISRATPTVDLSLETTPHMFPEPTRDTSVVVVARMAPGMPFGATFTIAVLYRPVPSGAKVGRDYRPVNEFVSLRRRNYALEDGRWVFRARVPVRIRDDNVREGNERFDLELYTGAEDMSVIRLLRADGSSCGDPCYNPVHITDDEDIPAFALSVDPPHIREADETSATATVSITNGKTFAAHRMVTFTLSGTAAAGSDFTVTPVDADGGTPGHQVRLRAGSTSAQLTVTAVDDGVEDIGEQIEISAALDGTAIGSRTVPVVDPADLVGVEIGFEELDAGIATGPFIARFTFDEEVEGFTPGDIDWGTDAGTTEDGTGIGLILADFTEVRAGREYTVRMTPTQSGGLSVELERGAATAIATGARSERKFVPLTVDLPENTMIVSRTSLTVTEGDEDGDSFSVLLTSDPTDTVFVTVSGTEGTAVTATGQRNLVFTTRTTPRRVTVTAGEDVNATDETVTLTLTASGGGYDGQTATVVVTVRDNDGTGTDRGGEMADEAAALEVLENLTPEAAAAALFGEEELSRARLAALDLMGNANGTYDLGDLLSWISRCERGEAKCGASPSPASNPLPGPVAALGALGRSRSAGGRRARTRHRSRRRTGRAWYGLVLLFVATMTWGCSEGLVKPPVEPDPGALTVWLDTPRGGGDKGALLLVEGPGIEAVRSSGFEVFEAGNSSSLQIVVSGVLSTGSVLELRVPDRTLVGQYRVQILQVAGDDYSLRDASLYRAMIMR